MRMILSECECHNVWQSEQVHADHMQAKATFQLYHGQAELQAVLWARLHELQTSSASWHMWQLSW